MKALAAIALALCAGILAASPVPLHVPADAVASQPQRYFVQLHSPSVTALQTHYDVRSAARQRDHARQLDQEHRTLLPFVTSHATRVDARFRVALNGFKVRATAQQVDNLERLPGVARVVPLRVHEMALAGSVPWIGAPSLWPDGDGTGVRIAIIDTGIDYTHLNFGGSGDTLDFLLNDPADLEPGTFPTDKVTGGYDFAGPVYDARDPESEPDPDPDPIDRHGHGSHVAGIAAGFGVGEHLGRGVAPGATLLALKVFSDEGGSTDLVVDAIEMALDPNGDGAIDDRVDVINMSLGSAFGHPDDPSAIAAQQAVNTGVVVVASAGNRAEVPYVTGSPAVAPGAISVAASWPGNRTHLALGIKGHPDVVGLHEAREGLGPVSVVAQPARGLLVAASGPADDGAGSPAAGITDNLACHPLDNAAALSGQIALVARGNCEFVTKYANVQATGAAAIVVYNDGTSAARLGPQTMNNIDDSIYIPGIMIGHDQGVALDALLAQGVTLSAALDPALRVAADPADDDTLAWFTSRGPGNGGSAFKPDISAPGYGIVSAAAGTGFDVATLNGTSMAAPHVAGAAALLLERDPQLAPAQVKALLQVSTTDANRWGPGSDSPYPLTLQGTGRLQLAEAAQQQSYAEPAGVSFGRLEAFAPVSRQVTTELHNHGDEARSYTVTHRPNQAIEGVTVSCPDSVDVAAGNSVTVTLGLSADPQAMPFDRAEKSQAEVDGWCVFDDGDQTVRVGYLAALDPVSMLRAAHADDQLQLTNFGPARGKGEPFMLMAASPLAPASAAAVAAVGLRPVDFGGFPLIEFGFAMWRPWESVSHLQLRLFIDNDEDGIEDFMLLITDWSALRGQTGSLITMQYPLDDQGEPIIDDGYLDWLFSSTDYNDHVMYAPFTQVTATGDVFLDPGDTRFAWRLISTARDGSESTLSGLADFSAYGEMDPVDVQPGSAATRPAPSVPMLWLYPTNPVGRQFQVLGAPPPG